jgi:hypothetical protein
MSTARTRHTATLPTDGRVLISGGDSEATVGLNNVELYDPVTMVFTRKVKIYQAVGNAGY